MPTQLLADITASSCALWTVGIHIYQRAAKVTVKQLKSTALTKKLHMCVHIIYAQIYINLHIYKTKF